VNRPHKLPVDLKLGAGAKCQLGVIDQAKSGVAVRTGANDLVAHHIVADIDPDQFGLADMHDLVADDLRLAHLGGFGHGGSRRNTARQAQQWELEHPANHGNPVHGRDIRGYR
jgi:hypothetical protein